LQIISLPQRDTSLSAVVKYLLETLSGNKRATSVIPDRNSNPINTIHVPNSPSPAF
jgi:hypothetical protein